MHIEQEFIALVQKHFQELTPLLDAELKSVLARPCSAAVKFLHVEYNSPHFGDDFSVSLWPMDAAGKLAGQGHWFLKGKAVAVPPEIYDAERFDDINPWNVASELMESWFVQRWRQKAKNSLPAFIGHHDSYHKTNLKTGEQTNWDEILASFQNANLQ